jgi:hypothetical protein
MSFDTIKLIIASIAIVLLLCGSGAYGAPANSSGAETRTYKFPATTIGTLYLAPAFEPFSDNHPLATARGNVTVQVPKGYLVRLKLSREAFEHPELIEQASSKGIDELQPDFMAMDDAEANLYNAAFAKSGHFQDATILMVQRSDVSDAAILKVAPMPKIEIITAQLTTLKGSCFSVLAQKFPNLRCLLLANCPLVGSSLKSLSACKKLEKLDVNHCGLDDEAVKYICQCSNLKELRIGQNPKMSDACVKYFLTLKHLTTLDMADVGISCDGFKQLKPLHLESLFIGDHVCAPKDIPEMKKVAKRVGIAHAIRKVDQFTKDVYAPLH